MPSKYPIRDSSITERQLAPDLRRRLRGGGSSYAATVTSGTGVIASYAHSTSQALSVEPWCGAILEVDFDTGTVASGDVSTGPWAMASDGSDATVTITGTVSTSPLTRAVVLALMVGSVDVQSWVVQGGFAVTVPVRRTGAVTVQLRAFADLIEGLTVTLSDATVEVRSV